MDTNDVLYIVACVAVTAVVSWAWLMLCLATAAVWLLARKGQRGRGHDAQT